MSRPAPRFAATCLAAALPLAMLGACGDDGKSGAGAKKKAFGNAVTVSGVDYGFTLDTQTVKAGRTKITFTNDGKDIHMLAMAPIKAGKTFADAKNALTSEDPSDDEGAFEDLDGPANQPQILTPGTSTTTYPELKAGTTYALVCFFPTAEGKSHYEVGMLNQLTVGSETSTETVETDGEITLADGTFTLPDLTSGKGTYALVNKGAKDHDVTLVKPADGTSFDQLLAFIDSYFESGQGKIGEMPGAIAGGSGVIPAGQTGYLTLDLPKGTYFLICTESDEDSADSKEHFRDHPKEKVEFTVG